MNPSHHLVIYDFSAAREILEFLQIWHVTHFIKFNPIALLLVMKPIKLWTHRPCAVRNSSFLAWLCKQVLTQCQWRARLQQTAEDYERKRSWLCNKSKVKVKVKVFPLQAWESSWIFSTFGIMKVGRSSPLRTGRLHPQESPWYSFLEAESTPGHVELSKFPEKIPSETTGDRSRDPSTCSAAP